jgi:two-component system alkaline phosphatase synthesis response regulator PhoP
VSKILIVEDDDAMAAALRDGFGVEGHEVTLAADGIDGLSRARTAKPDLLILDVMLPKMSGLDVCKTLRAEGRDVPIIMLTARGQEIDKVLGLKLGADDYVTKPFGFMELLARCEALLRRVEGRTAGVERHSFGDVAVDFKKAEVRRKGKVLDLSAREIRLLQYMVEHRGELLTREQILEAVWGYEHAPLTRTVDMHVAKLRKKIEPVPEEPVWIVTVHRMGYKFCG